MIRHFSGMVILNVYSLTRILLVGIAKRTKIKNHTRISIEQDASSVVGSRLSYSKNFHGSQRYVA